MRGLLVDFGGVLTTNVFDSFRQFCVAEGLEPDALRNLLKTDPQVTAQLRKLERGELSEQAFSEKLGPMLGVSDTVDLVDRLFGQMGPEPEMIEAVRIARAGGIKTGLISNSWGTNRYDHASLQQLFDGIVISGQVGLYKPQPEIYELGAQRIGLSPGECVFVDDLRENCQAADGVGMTSIIHRGPEATLAELERLFQTSLR
jgi:epoxide hydrolase-like predicted phosphatase